MDRKGIEKECCLDRDISNLHGLRCRFHFPQKSNRSWQPRICECRVADQEKPEVDQSFGCEPMQKENNTSLDKNYQLICWY